MSDPGVFLRWPVTRGKPRWRPYAERPPDILWVLQGISDTIRPSWPSLSRNLERRQGEIPSHGKGVDRKVAPS